VAALAAEVYDRPTSFPLLKVIHRQLGGFVSPQPARKQKGQECPVALAFESACVRSLPERDPLFGRQPVAQPYAKFLYALEAPDASRKVSAEESAASQASRRTAPIRRLIVPGARCRDSGCIRWRMTTVLLKHSLGSEQYQSTNSSMAWRYPRCASRHDRRLRTADFATSRSGNRKTDLADGFWHCASVLAS